MPPINRCKKCNHPMKYLKTDSWASMTEVYWECETCHEKYIVYPGRIPLRYRFFFAVLGILDHNEKDHVFYHLLGLEFRACSRCLGVYIAGVICFILFGYMYLINVQLPFYPVFVVSMVFGGLTLIDYATVEIFHIRKGSNRIRVITGVFLGIGAMLYFWLLPTDWWFRMITLLFYNLLAILVAYISMRMNRSNEETQVSVSQ